MPRVVSRRSDWRVNGEARALGKLHDRRGAADGVARAYRVLERFAQAGGMTPGILFGIYSEARTASNAATAYLALGQTEQVLDYAERAREIVDASPSPWSYALIRLDMAMALLNPEHPEPEGASALGAQVVAAVRYLRIESIQPPSPRNELPPEEEDWHRFRQLRQLGNHGERPGWNEG
jgi:hypothetical protein